MDTRCISRAAFKCYTYEGNLRADETLDNGHLCLAELLAGISAGSVGQVRRLTDADVVGEGDVLDVDIGVLPLSEELDTLVSERSDVCGGTEMYVQSAWFPLQHCSCHVLHAVECDEVCRRSSTAVGPSLSRPASLCRLCSAIPHGLLMQLHYIAGVLGRPLILYGGFCLPCGRGAAPSRSGPSVLPPPTPITHLRLQLLLPITAEVPPLLLLLLLTLPATSPRGWSGLDWT